MGLRSETEALGDGDALPSLVAPGGPEGPGVEPDAAWEGGGNNLRSISISKSRSFDDMVPRVSDVYGLASPRTVPDGVFNSGRISVHKAASFSRQSHYWNHATGTYVSLKAPRATASFSSRGVGESVLGRTGGSGRGEAGGGQWRDAYKRPAPPATPRRPRAMLGQKSGLRPTKVHASLEKAREPQDLPASDISFRWDEAKQGAGGQRLEASDIFRSSTAMMDTYFGAKNAANLRAALQWPRTLESRLPGAPSGRVDTVVIAAWLSAQLLGCCSEPNSEEPLEGGGGSATRPQGSTSGGGGSATRPQGSTSSSGGTAALAEDRAAKNNSIPEVLAVRKAVERDVLEHKISLAIKALDMSHAELAQQAGLHCVERGEMLFLVWRRRQALVEEERRRLAEEKKAILTDRERLEEEKKLLQRRLHEAEDLNDVYMEKLEDSERSMAVVQGVLSRMGAGVSKEKRQWKRGTKGARAFGRHGGGGGDSPSPVKFGSKVSGQSRDGDNGEGGVRWPPRRVSGGFLSMEGPRSDHDASSDGDHDERLEKLLGKEKRPLKSFIKQKSMQLAADTPRSAYQRQLTTAKMRAAIFADSDSEGEAKSLCGSRAGSRYVSRASDDETLYIPGSNVRMRSRKEVEVEYNRLKNKSFESRMTRWFESDDDDDDDEEEEEELVNAAKKKDGPKRHVKPPTKARPHPLVVGPASGDDDTTDEFDSHFAKPESSPSPTKGAYSPTKGASLWKKAVSKEVAKQKGSRLAKSFLEILSSAAKVAPQKAEAEPTAALSKELQAAVHNTMLSDEQLAELAARLEELSFGEEALTLFAMLGDEDATRITAMLDPADLAAMMVPIGAHVTGMSLKRCKDRIGAVMSSMGLVSCVERLESMGDRIRAEILLILAPESADFACTIIESLSPQVVRETLEAMTTREVVVFIESLMESDSKVFVSTLARELPYVFTPTEMTEIKNMSHKVKKLMRTASKNPFAKKIVLEEGTGKKLWAGVGKKLGVTQTGFSVMGALSKSLDSLRNNQVKAGTLISMPPNEAAAVVSGMSVSEAAAVLTSISDPVARAVVCAFMANKALAAVMMEMPDHVCANVLENMDEDDVGGCIHAIAKRDPARSGLIASALAAKQPKVAKEMLAGLAPAIAGVVLANVSGRGGAALLNSGVVTPQMLEAMLTSPGIPEGPSHVAKILKAMPIQKASDALGMMNHDSLACLMGSPDVADLADIVSLALGGARPLFMMQALTTNTDFMSDVLEKVTPDVSERLFESMSSQDSAHLMERLATKVLSADCVEVEKYKTMGCMARLMELAPKSALEGLTNILAETSPGVVSVMAASAAMTGVKNTSRLLRAMRTVHIAVILRSLKAQQDEGLLPSKGANGEDLATTLLESINESEEAFSNPSVSQGVSLSMAIGLSRRARAAKRNANFKQLISQSPGEAATLLLMAPADVRSKSLSTIVVQDGGAEGVASMLEGLESFEEFSSLLRSLGAHATRVYSHLSTEKISAMLSKAKPEDGKAALESMKPWITLAVTRHMGAYHKPAFVAIRAAGFEPDDVEPMDAAQMEIDDLLETIYMPPSSKERLNPKYDPRRGEYDRMRCQRILHEAMPFLTGVFTFYSISAGKDPTTMSLRQFFLMAKDAGFSKVKQMQLSILFHTVVVRRQNLVQEGDDDGDEDIQGGGGADTGNFVLNNMSEFCEGLVRFAVMVHRSKADASKALKATSKMHTLSLETCLENLLPALQACKVTAAKCTWAWGDKDKPDVHDALWTKGGIYERVFGARARTMDRDGRTMLNHTTFVELCRAAGLIGAKLSVSDCQASFVLGARMYAEHLRETKKGTMTKAKPYLHLDAFYHAIAMCCGGHFPGRDLAGLLELCADRFLQPNLNNILTG